jgi:hypothetical protein
MVATRSRAILDDRRASQTRGKKPTPLRDRAGQLRAQKAFDDVFSHFGLAQAKGKSGAAIPYVAFRVRGDCCEPFAKDGELIMVDRSRPSPGDLTVTFVQGDAMPMLKRLKSKLDFIYPFVPGSDCVAMIEFEQPKDNRCFYVPVDQIQCIARVAKIGTDLDQQKRT